MSLSLEAEAFLTWLVVDVNFKSSTKELQEAGFMDDLEHVTIAGRKYLNGKVVVAEGEFFDQFPDLFIGDIEIGRKLLGEYAGKSIRLTITEL